MIVINIDKAKTIGHEMRRSARAKEFEPLDDIIAKQLPGSDLQQVEAERQAIRDKYKTIQQQIDTASTVEQLKEALTLEQV